MSRDLDHVRVPRPAEAPTPGRGEAPRLGAHADVPGELKAKVPDLHQGRIIVIAAYFPEYDRRGNKTGRELLQASHGIEEHTGNHVVLPGDHPRDLGATFDPELREWVLPASGGGR